MKHWISSFALVCLSGVAFSQTSFTIIRPLDRAKVREKVRVTFPKGSIPAAGYIGVFLGGKFIEAVRPPLVPVYKTRYDSKTKKSSSVMVGQQFEYLLDTKGRGIPDTEPGKPLKLEAVLFVDYNEQPRIVDRSSVEINVANQSSISIPSGGIKLRYSFVAGKEMIYDLERRILVEPITAEQNKLGGKAAQLDVESENIRLLYAIDNTYQGGDGLVRIQPLPELGKHYAVMTAANSSGPTVYQENEMAPIYMKVTPTGEEVF